LVIDLSGRLGALRERDFRLLFSATTITTAGDRLAAIALVFAVLDMGGSATDLGLVLAARQAVSAAFLLAGGVLSDRLPRNLVLVGASLVQGGAQAVTAALVLSGRASVAALVGLQALYGLGNGLVIPAEVGLVPQTVSPERLQQANALQGLSRSVVGVLGPAIGGAIVVAGSPGLALAIDAVSFGLCAALLARIRVAARPGTSERPGFLRELREGWSEFVSRRWLWATVGLFGLGNLVFSAWWVLGPVVAKERLGGAGAWAAILTAGGVGSVLGGFFALRLRPGRPLLVSVLAASPLVLQLVVLALHAPTALVAAASLAAGAGLAIHLALWFTVFQREVPEHAQSRVSSYDALGSFVLIPLGTALAGLVAAGIGTDATLFGAAAVFVVCTLTMVAMPSVRQLRLAPLEVEPAAAT
jgi:MFS family permease